MSTVSARVKPPTMATTHNNNAGPPPAAGGQDDDGTTTTTKKKKQSSIVNMKSDGRLVEYLMVVSSVPRNQATAGQPGGDDDGKPASEGGEEWNLSTSFDDEDVEVNQGFKPVITARYPLHDHDDNPLHDNVTFFCHPSGSIQLKKQPYMPKVRRKKYKYTSMTVPVG